MHILFKKEYILFVISIACISHNLLAYDCSNAPDFIPFESQKVTVSVERSFWTVENGERVELFEPVCEFNSPQEIGAYDIRGQEEIFYYCFYQKPRPNMFECQTTFKGKLAQLVIRPAVVVRSLSGTNNVRDYHSHVFLVPEGDYDKFRDTFMRSMSRNLSKQETWLDIVSGGRGPDSGEDSFYIRVHFLD